MSDVAVFTTDVVRGVSVVRCSGEVDMATAPAMRDAVDLLLDQRPLAVVIDACVEQPAPESGWLLVNRRGAGSWVGPEDSSGLHHR